MFYPSALPFTHPSHPLQMNSKVRCWIVTTGIFFFIFVILGIIFSSLTNVLTEPCPYTYTASDGYTYNCITLSCEDIYGDIHPCDCSAYCYTPAVSVGGPPFVVSVLSSPASGLVAIIVFWILAFFCCILFVSLSACRETCCQGGGNTVHTTSTVVVTPPAPAVQETVTTTTTVQQPAYYAVRIFFPNPFDTHASHTFLASSSARLCSAPSWRCLSAADLCRSLRPTPTHLRPSPRQPLRTTPVETLTFVVELISGQLRSLCRSENHRSGSLADQTATWRKNSI